MQKKENTVDLPISWKSELKKNSNYEILIKPVETILNKINSGKTIYPKVNQLFRAFELCSFSSTKVVILGQDPYHNNGQADGLAFSVSNKNKLPPSLQNILKEVNNDIGKSIINDGNLKSWASQGVLLLNTCLSVECSKPNSHKNIGWNNLINSTINLLNQKRNIVFMLWGKHAQSKTYLINKKNNRILKASHPSPLSSHRGFFGCKHFSKANEYLLNNGQSKINW